MKKEPTIEGCSEFYSPKFSDPHRNLLAEILSRAIRDYAIETAECGAEANRVDAMRWLCIHNNDSFPYHEWSFAWICDHLDLDPYVIRDKVMHLQRHPTDSFYTFLIRLPNVSS